MLFEMIYDLPMYQWLLNPITAELERRGHFVLRANTRPNLAHPQTDGSLAIQNVAYLSEHQPDRPRFFMNHGSSASKPWVLDMPIDFFLSPSDYWAKAAVAKSVLSGAEYKIVTQLGYPRMDVLLAEQKNKQETRKRLGLSDDEPLVVCFPTYRKPGAAPSLWVRQFHYVEVLRQLNDAGFKVWVFPHQMDTTGDFENLDMEHITVSHEYGIERLQIFAAADVIVSDTSGAAYEACGLDIPIVRTGEVHRIESVYREVDFSPVVALDQVVAEVQNQLQKPEEFQDQRQYWANYILGPCDGLASQRVVDILERECWSVR